MKTWYIAGPMRSVIDYNYPMFDRARDHTARENPGDRIISPADEDREAGIVDETGRTVEMKDEFDIAQVLAKDIRIVTEADCIVLLPGWSESLGARVEAHVAAVTETRVFLFSPFDDGTNSVTEVTPESLYALTFDPDESDCDGYSCCNMQLHARIDTNPRYYEEADTNGE